MKAQEVSVRLGGAERRMRFDINAVATFEELTGKSAYRGIRIESVRDVRAILYACLAAHHEAAERPPALTLNQVGVLLSGDDGAVERVQTAVAGLIRANTPDAEDSEGEDADAPLGETAAATSETPSPSPSSSSDSGPGTSGG